MQDHNQGNSSSTIGVERTDWRARLFLPLTMTTIVVVGLLIWLMTRQGPSTPAISATDASSTREVIQFATGEAGRLATRVAQAPSQTAEARATGAAVAEARKTASAQVAAASTTQARSTAQARATEAIPVTQTARARAFAEAHAEANATVLALVERAIPLFGPLSGKLEQLEGDQAPQVSCFSPRTTVGDFIAEATFYNPTASDPLPSPPAWDYGIVFSNLDGENDTEYRLILASDGSWTLNLHSSGFDISNRDSTPFLDLSNEGSNALKLYVTGDTSYLYINGQYVDTLDLSMFGMGQSSGGRHDVSICAGMLAGNAIKGRPTTYEALRVWSLP